MFSSNPLTPSTCLWFLHPTVPRIAAKQAKLPKEVIEIQDTLRVGYGDDNGETLTVTDSLMQESCDTEAQKEHERLMNEFNEDTEVNKDDPEQVAKLHHVNLLHCLVLYVSQSVSKVHFWDFKVW